MKKIFTFWELIMILAVLVCSSAVFGEENTIPDDGVYYAKFETDSTMFKVNEACDGKGILTVRNGEMTIHISLVSKSILNLFAGLAEDAAKEDAKLLEPTVDDITYSDGFQDKVHGFDIPVPYLDETFDVALIGKKGKWYDHKVSVSDPVLIEDTGKTDVPDGTYLCGVTLEGGSGKAYIESPAEITAENDTLTAMIVWSSKYYEYMLVNDVRYEPIQSEENSTFEIPIELDTDLQVSACTVAMSQPHLIDYTLHFDSSTLEQAE